MDMKKEILKSRGAAEVLLAALITAGQLLICFQNFCWKRWGSLHCWGCGLCWRLQFCLQSALSI